MSDLIFAPTLFLAVLVLLVGCFSLNTLGNWHKACLQIVQSRADDSIWLVCGVSLLLSFFFLCLACHPARFPKICHRIALSIVFGYVFILFNPQLAVSNAKSEELVSCRNGYAYQLESGDYVACENFDENFEARYNGKVRHDLIIKGR